MKVRLLALMSAIFFSSEPILAQENTACDIRTDQYTAIFRTGTAKDGLTLCAEFSEGGGDSDPELRRVFAVLMIGGKQQVLKEMSAASTGVAFGFWAGPYEEEAGQSVRKLYMWFAAGTSTYVAESCEGGRLCSPNFVRAIRIETGKKPTESFCTEDPDELWCKAMNYMQFFDEDERTLKFKAKHPKLFAVKPMPPATAKLLK